LKKKIPAQFSNFSSVDATPLSEQKWPEFNEELLVEDEIEIVLQVNGKVRDKMMIPTEATKEEVEALAMESERVQSFVEGLTVRKVIVVPGRLVNVVAN